jgi:hypothetical protein
VDSCTSNSSVVGIGSELSRNLANCDTSNAPITPGTRAELKKIMMTERHHMRCSAAHPSLFMTGYATDLSQQCKIFFFICGRVPSASVEGVGYSLR